MRMNFPRAAALTLLAISLNSCTNESSVGARLVPQSDFPVVASFDGQQVTGVTVANDGRIFANFPRWRDGVVHSVVEVRADGGHVPYPDAAWNEWTGEPRENGFTCVQSVVAHNGSLFVLDPSNPMMKGVVGRPTLFEFDLATNALKRKWVFDEKVAPPRSYLNDLRVDDERGLIYITESGLGAIVVLNTRTGTARRLLDDSASTKSEPLVLYNDGVPFTKENGNPNRIHADGIALHDGYLYYHAVTGVTLYRISTKALADESLSAADLKAQVENLGATPMPDGMIFDRAGNLYMADLANNAVVYRTPEGELRTLLKDPNLHWADTFAIDPQGRLLLTDSMLNQAKPGQSAAGITTTIYRVELPTTGR